MGVHKCNMDYTEIFKKSAQDQIIIKGKKNIPAVHKSVWYKILFPCWTGRRPWLFFCQQSSSFLCQCNEGTASRKEGMRVENLEQKVIRAGYEENTEDFQTAQMFRDIFHRLASWSPCPCVWAAWRGPGSAACLAPWAALLQKCFRRVLPVERAFIGSPWLWMLCNPRQRTPRDPCPAACFPAGKRLSGLSSLPATTPKVPSLRHWLRGGEGGVGKTPRRWVIVHTSVSGTWGPWVRFGCLGGLAVRWEAEVVPPRYILPGIVMMSTFFTRDV